MQRFSPLALIILASLVLATVLVAQFGGALSSSKNTSQPVMGTLNVVQPSLMRLRLDVKEYLIGQDQKYVYDFDQESKRFLALLDTLESQHNVAQNTSIAQSIQSLRADIHKFNILFKSIVALEEDNMKIESGVFIKYNAMLEEHPNHILFQAFTDNDPMSGNSAAHLLDASLKYKLAVASYSLNNDEFFLIQSNELKDKIKKHADKIELLVENKESLKRIKSFKEVFALYAQGFEHLAKNIQAKRLNVSSAFEEVVPRMLNNSQTLLLAFEKEL